MMITMPDLLAETLVDHEVEPILCGPVGSCGPISHGTPRNVDYMCALLRESDQACYGDE